MHNLAYHQTLAVVAEHRRVYERDAAQTRLRRDVRRRRRHR
jgi:hypothetical protein